MFHHRNNIITKDIITKIYLQVPKSVQASQLKEFVTYDHDHQLSIKEVAGIILLGSITI